MHFIIISTVKQTRRRGLSVSMIIASPSPSPSSSSYPHSPALGACRVRSRVYKYSINKLNGRKRLLIARVGAISKRRTMEIGNAVSSKYPIEIISPREESFSHLGSGAETHRDNFKRFRLDSRLSNKHDGDFFPFQGEGNSIDPHSIGFRFQSSVRKRSSLSLPSSLDRRKCR